MYVTKFTPSLFIYFQQRATFNPHSLSITLSSHHIKYQFNQRPGGGRFGGGTLKLFGGGPLFILGGGGRLEGGGTLN